MNIYKCVYIYRSSTRAARHLDEQFYLVVHAICSYHCHAPILSLFAHCSDMQKLIYLYIYIERETERERDRER